MSENLQWIISTAGAGLAAVGGGLAAVLKWHDSHIKETMDHKVREAVLMATAELTADIAGVRERVTTLETKWESMREDIVEIKSKLDRLDGHMHDMPRRIAEAIR